jgi:beta-glucuronidase
VLDNLPDLVIDTGVEKPLIVSELGAGALAGMHAPEEDLAVFSEEYQALVYRKQIEMLGRQDDVRGISPWVLKDFRSALRTHPTYQDYWNRKGLVADDGTRKLAFEVLREHYAERAKQGR